MSRNDTLLYFKSYVGILFVMITVALRVRTLESDGNDYQECSRSDVTCVFFDLEPICEGCVMTIQEALDHIPSNYDSTSTDFVDEFSSLSFNLNKLYYESLDNHRSFFTVYLVANQTTRRNINITGVHGKRVAVSIEPYPQSEINIHPKNELDPLVYIFNNTNWFSIFKFSSGDGSLIFSSTGGPLIEIRNNTGSHLIFQDISSHLGNELLPEVEPILIINSENDNVFTYFQNINITIGDGPSSVLFEFENNLNQSTYEISNMILSTSNKTNCTSRGEVTFIRTINSRGYVNSNFFEDSFRNVSIYFSTFENEEESPFFLQLRNNIFSWKSCDTAIESATRLHILSSNDEDGVFLLGNLFVGSSLEVMGEENIDFSFSCNVMVNSTIYSNGLYEEAFLLNNTFLNDSNVLLEESTRPFPYYTFAKAQPCPIVMTFPSLVPPQYNVDFLGRARNLTMMNSGPFIDTSSNCVQTSCPFPRGICNSENSCFCRSGEYAGEECACYLSAGYVYSSSSNTCFCNRTGDNSGEDVISGITQCTMSLSGELGSNDDSDDDDDSDMLLMLLLIICPLFGLVPCLCVYMVCVICIEVIIICIVLMKALGNKKNRTVSPDGGGNKEDEEMVTAAGDTISVVTSGSSRPLNFVRAIGGSVVTGKSSISDEHSGLSKERILDLGLLDDQMLVYAKDSDKNLSTEMVFD